MEAKSVAYCHFFVKKYGLAPPQLNDLLRQTAQSLRPITAQESTSITGIRLRLAKAREGETLQQLSERTGNRWNLDYTAMANGLTANQRLVEGQLIKIAKEERYLGQ